ncbi:MAG TPA: LPS export ABC transporter periplasmic protein LptC [Candidatus Binataceae bacterium]|nr:LPS export ABC transporter periplasmic protein LptC [Candidatus Binataceae bacterium]
MSPRSIAKALAGIGIGALLVIVISAVWVVGKRDRQQRLLARAVKLVPGTLLDAHNFHWTQMKGDHELWQLQAKEAAYSNDRASARLSGAELSMKLDDGKDMSAHAQRVLLKLQGNHVLQADFSGGLVLNYKGMVITTDKATFFPDRDDLQAAGPVTIDGPQFSVRGVGLDAHPRAQTFTLKAQTDTQVTIKQNGAAQPS